MTESTPQRRAVDAYLQARLDVIALSVITSTDGADREAAVQQFWHAWEDYQTAAAPLTI